MSTTKQRRMRGPTSFTRTALRRAIQAAADTGIPHRIEIDLVGKKITLVPGKLYDGNTSDLDRWLREHKG